MTTRWLLAWLSLASGFAYPFAVARRGQTWNLVSDRIAAIPVTSSPKAVPSGTSDEMR